MKSAARQRPTKWARSCRRLSATLGTAKREHSTSSSSPSSLSTSSEQEPLLISAFTSRQSTSLSSRSMASPLISSSVEPRLSTLSLEPRLSTSSTSDSASLLGEPEGHRESAGDGHATGRAMPHAACSGFVATLPCSGFRLPPSSLASIRAASPTSSSLASITSALGCPPSLASISSALEPSSSLASISLALEPSSSLASIRLALEPSS
mmetsp:Transcript_80706/g.261564  ORF Transcript_80706/g.261564 Transcript_80706/m.261564 type:complete len:209 (-) Transcript_80706:895-1521(-)